LNIYNGEANGGPINIDTAFLWSGGSISAPVIVSGQSASVSITGVVNLVIGGSLDVTAAPGNTFSINKASIIIDTGIITNEANSDCDCESSNFTLSGQSDSGFIFENRGTLRGNNIRFSGSEILVQNDGNLGSTNAGSLTKITIDKATLTLTQSSTVYFDILDVSSFSSITVTGTNGVLNLNGTFVVRFGVGFYPSSTTIIPLINYESVFGYESVKVTYDISQWTNLNKCNNYGISNDVTKKQYKLTFSSCTTVVNTPPSTSATSNNATIVSVVLAVVLLAVCVGFIAWCKKKYKKKPWDRLRDDRF